MLRPCTTSAGFTATPSVQRRVDLRALRTRLETQGYEIVVDAGVILLVRRGIESSIYQNGKVLLKTTVEADAEAAYVALRTHLEANWR